VTKKKVIRSTAKLTTLDDFLGEEGTRDEFEAVAVKEVPRVADRAGGEGEGHIPATT
jgi:hypothetical protein